MIMIICDPAEILTAVADFQGRIFFQSRQKDFSRGLIRQCPVRRQISSVRPVKVILSVDKEDVFSAAHMVQRLICSCWTGVPVIASGFDISKSGLGVVRVMYDQPVLSQKRKAATVAKKIWAKLKKMDVAPESAAIASAHSLLICHKDGRATACAIRNVTDDLIPDIARALNRMIHLDA